MLVLAYLLTRNDAWRSATIRLIVRVEAGEAEAQRTRVEQVLKDVRIPGEILIVEAGEDHGAQAVEVSRASSIVFMGLGFGREQFVDWLGNDIGGLMPQLPICVLTMAAEEVDLSADPDAGEESARARAKDAFDDATSRRKATAKALEKSLVALEKAEADTTERAAELQISRCRRDREIRRRSLPMTSSRWRRPAWWRKISASPWTTTMPKSEAGGRRGARRLPG